MNIHITAGSCPPSVAAAANERRNTAAVTVSSMANQVHRRDAFSAVRSAPPAGMKCEPFRFSELVLGPALSVLRRSPWPSESVFATGLGGVPGIEGNAPRSRIPQAVMLVSNSCPEVAPSRRFVGVVGPLFDPSTGGRSFDVLTITEGSDTTADLSKSTR